MKPYPYQKEAARTLATSLARYGSALDASDTGTGKTYTASALAAAAGKGVCVVCPKSVIPVWQEVLTGFGATPAFVLNYEMLRTGRTPWMLRCGGKGTKYAWSSTIPRNTLFIWDEVHRCKTRGTANSKMLEAAGPRFLNLMLSATVAESPLDLFTTGLLLGLHNKDDYKEWCLQHGCFRMGFTLMFAASGEKAERGLEKIHKAIFPARGVRVRKSQIPGFPANQIITQPWDFGDEGQIAEAYAEMEKEMAELQIKIDDDPGSLPITITLRARQKSELLKVTLLVERCNDLLEEGNSVVIFVNFNQTLDGLVERLAEHNPSVVRGGQTSAERQGFIDQFQTNKTRVALVNVQAGGTGVSLHDVHKTHPRVSLISPSFSATDMVQVVGRIHRNGGTDVTQWFAYVGGTIEAAVVRSVLRKIDQIQTINDGNNLHVSPEGVIYPPATPNLPMTKSPISESQADAAACASSGDLTSNLSTLSPTGGSAEDGAASRSEISLSVGTSPADNAGREANGVCEAGTAERKVETVDGEEWIVGQAGDEGFAARTAGVRTLDLSPEILRQKLEAEANDLHIARAVAAARSEERPAHAKHGPSGLKMKERCAQFLNHDESNPVAERGTALHKALETDDDSGIVDLDESKVLQRTRRIKEIILRTIPFPYDSVHREVVVDIDLGGGVTTYGTCDELVISGHEAVMLDYKFGYWAVDDAEQNLQTWSYVLGTFQRHQQLSKIAFHFLQPRLNNVSSGTFTRADIPRLTARIRAVIVAADNPDSPYTPGQGLCEFCAKAGNGTCPTLNERALVVAKRYDDSLDIPDLVHGSQITDPAVLARLLLLAPAVKKAAAGWTKRAVELIDQGVVPGFTLKSRGGKRGITSAQAAWEMVKSKLSPEEFADCADLSVPALLKAWSAKAPKGDKKRSAEELEDALADAGILERAASTMVLSRKHEVAGAEVLLPDAPADFTSVADE